MNAARNQRELFRGRAKRVHFVGIGGIGMSGIADAGEVVARAAQGGFKTARVDRVAHVAHVAHAPMQQACTNGSQHIASRRPAGFELCRCVAGEGVPS